MSVSRYVPYEFTDKFTAQAKFEFGTETKNGNMSFRQVEQAPILTWFLVSMLSAARPSDCLSKADPSTVAYMLLVQGVFVFFFPMSSWVIFCVKKVIFI